MLRAMRWACATHSPSHCPTHSPPHSPPHAWRNARRMPDAMRNAMPDAMHVRNVRNGLTEKFCHLIEIISRRVTRACAYGVFAGQVAERGTFGASFEGATA